MGMLRAAYDWIMNTEKDKEEEAKKKKKKGYYPKTSMGQLAELNRSDKEK